MDSKMSLSTCFTYTSLSEQQKQREQEKCTERAIKINEISASGFLQPSITYTNQNLHSTYAENFDLSLLPQDCDISLLNTPTTVHQYKNCLSPTTKCAIIPTPDIKIEQAWTTCDQMKLEQNLDTFSSYYDTIQAHTTQLPTKSTQLLVPNTISAQSYPSPQSSPAQSDYCFPQAQFSGVYSSFSSSHSSLYASSPCPSIEAHSIKQELHILPPSPPESSCEVPSPHTEVKSEPFDTDTESIVSDLNSLLTQQEQEQKQNVLREYLQDNTFQKRHNLKPLALESFIGDLEAVRGDIEPVISLALQHAKSEADETCRQLQISHDPGMWSVAQVHAWLQSTIAQFKLPTMENLTDNFQEDGGALIQLSQEEFDRRAPEVSKSVVT